MGPFSRLTLAVLAVLLLVPATLADDRGVITWGESPAPEAVAGETTPEAIEAPAFGAGRLGLLQRRRMHLTIGTITDLMRTAAAEGRLDEAMQLPRQDRNAAVAMIVMEDYLAEHQVAVQAELQSERDWPAFFEAILDFIERMIPLIIRIIELFSGLL